MAQGAMGMVRLSTCGVAAAITLAAGVCLGQVSDAPPPGAAPVIVTTRAGGYQARTGQVVYDIGWEDQTGGGIAGGGAAVYDDVTFGGPDGPITLTGLTMGLWEPATSPLPPALYMRVSFYPNHDSTVAPGARPYSGTPVQWTLLVEVPGAFATPLSAVTLDDSNVFTTPGDRTCGVYIELFLDAAMTQYADTWGLVRRVGFTAPLVGQTDPYGWFNPQNSTTTPEVITNSMRTGSATSQRGTYLVLEGANPYCSADFDNDGDIGTDQDIEAFFACLAGNCCATCGSADFNGDGDLGTDADIESFFRVLGGGSC